MTATIADALEVAERERDQYRAALERILEIGEDATSSRRDLMQAFRIADEALNG